ncbi:MAG: hypothetical protein J5761_02155 [Paludibacteraceae bacterium]|nr:hypothetical protein [Paludibacteraceae bacterium]
MKWRMMMIGFLVLTLSAYAEHRFEGGLHGGLAGWNASTVYVSPQAGFHGGGHIYYACLAPRIIGVRTGVTLDCHNASFGRQDYSDTYSTRDIDNLRMDISYTIASLRETYTTWSVGIPLQVAFHYRPFMFLIGPKAVFPLAGSWHQTVNHAALSVYYPDYDNLVEDSYPLGASRDFSIANRGRLTPPKVQWWLAMEFNYSFTLNYWARNYRSYLIVGAYFNYGFTPFRPASGNTTSLLMLTDTRDGLPLQRVLTPVMEANRQGQKLISEGRLFDVGIKISYAIAPFKPHKEAYINCHCKR